MPEDKPEILSSSPAPSFEGPSCPLPLAHADQIVIGHGSGGRMTHDLVTRVFQAYLSSPALAEANDFARLDLPIGSGMQGKIVVSTDSHIVHPLFFPGGDIGRLSICGTVNDVAVSGGIPLYITAGFILEEGLPVETLQRVLASMQEAAQEAGVQVVAGDTKVAEKGKVDQLFINTTGVGWTPPGVSIGGEMAKEGDAVLVSGALGDHGMAVLTARGELGFSADIRSDVAPLNHMIQEILRRAPHTHVLRDPTRGGLATTLNEIASQSKVCIELDEERIPVNPVVQAACEMLGFDPLYIANEGKLIVITPAEEALAALAAMHSNLYGKNAVQIGRVRLEPSSRVLMRTLIGGTRILDTLAGEMLPRIC